ncbi:MAG TPA: protein DpdE [Verrucomicrobiae bacterium]|jgi:ATP-dependent helicase HepA|nr:protein DpdE [Verrucomicrobiae bacterium]
MNGHLGIKVVVQGRESAGFGEVYTLPDTRNIVEIRYYRNPVEFTSDRVRWDALLHPKLPAQTRAFCDDNGTFKYGRILICRNEDAQLRTYLFQLSGNGTPLELAENQFHVQADVGSADAVRTLSELAQETPFFFEQRFTLLKQFLRQSALSHGIPALLSSKIYFFQHQVEIAARILKDPTIRYLLADEVGLGKTIETGIVLRQLHLDYPEARMVVVAPDALVPQWSSELSERFGLYDVLIVGHSQLCTGKILVSNWDVVVIDEAHQIVATRFSSAPRQQIYDAVKTLSRGTRHLLLLSATPVLHHNEELLALLELLDPASYRREELTSFEQRASRRQELGRAFLALSSSQVPAMIRRRAAKMVELLPNDQTVASFVVQINNLDCDLQKTVRALQLHVSETYRIYRRMLRTRRRWLSEGQTSFTRKVEATVEYQLDDEGPSKLWKLLEDWRTEVATIAHHQPARQTELIDCYIAMAEAISSDSTRLNFLLDAMIAKNDVGEVEHRLLLEIRNTFPPNAIENARCDLVTEILRQRIRRDPLGSKYVVFCPNARICQHVAECVGGLIPTEALVQVHEGLSRSKCAERMRDFEKRSEFRVLLTDSIGEEGFNLQYAKLLVTFDFPWVPMRLEQRLGRLDRINREGRISCHIIMTVEDENLALDEAWRQVVTDGFGLFEDSVSDLQGLIESLLPKLKQCAFFGGPSALIAMIPEVKQIVAKERDDIAEQDIVDGMHTLRGSNHEIWSDLATADAEEEAFGRSLKNYFELNIGLEEIWDDDRVAFHFRRRKWRDPIVSTQRLIGLAFLNSPSTVHRTVATDDLSLEFLRIGHAGIQACQELLQWDERGRAFAMWRSVPGETRLRFVFRYIISSRVDLRTVVEELDRVNWDPIQRGGLLRLVRGWYPDSIHERFMNESGEPITPEIANFCRKPYERGRDINLGSHRADYVRDAVGADMWKSWCLHTAATALKEIGNTEEFRAQLSRASLSASEHFSLLEARLRARVQAGVDSEQASADALKIHQTIKELVQTLLVSPLVTIDTVGVYLLSERPFWEEGLK